MYSECWFIYTYRLLRNDSCAWWNLFSCLCVCVCLYSAHIGTIIHHRAGIFLASPWQPHSHTVKRRWDQTMLWTGLVQMCGVSFSVGAGRAWCLRVQTQWEELSVCRCSVQVLWSTYIHIWSTNIMLNVKLKGNT